MQINRLCLPDANAKEEIRQHKISITRNTNFWNEIWMNRYNHMLHNGYLTAITSTFVCKGPRLYTTQKILNYLSYIMYIII